MRVELSHITKIFGTLRANDDVSMAFDRGRIYAILGENGAGKSTLMKILSGFQPADGGQISIDGKAVTFKSPADALAQGIGMLHQDPLDVPNLTVWENMLLGRSEGMFPNRAWAQEALARHTGKLGFVLRPTAYVDSLTIGERQQLEIVRLLSLGAKVLILDEPTTGISAEQKDTLFRSLKQLAADDGLIVILVSHKLEDVEVLCDEVYILRAGKVVGQREMPCPAQQLVAMMFGQELQRTPRPPLQRGEVILSAKGLRIPDDRLTVENVTLDVHAGEVIGLAGLDGSGQRAFVRACAGLRAPSHGELYFKGRHVNHTSYHEMASQGVAYASAGRLEEGLVSGLTLTEHFALVSPAGLRIDWLGAMQRTTNAINLYNIRGQPTSPIQTLSGGNQQRTLIAMLPEKLSLLLLESPTRGLDVESAAWVWQQLLKRRAQGTAIIFVSPDLDEIVEYSDRIAVFFGGRVTLVDDPSTTSVDQLGQLIGGKTA